MAKVTLADGTEVEMLTPEEAKAQSDAAAAKALEDFKKANPEKTPEQLAEEKKIADEQAKKDGEPLAVLTKTVTDLQSTLRARDIADFAKTYAGADKAKQDEYKTAFSRLTGYESTPEGLAEQAVAAARLIGIDPKTVDVSGVASTGNRNVDTGKPAVATEADKVVQKALGITAEDVKKFGEQAGVAVPVVEEKK